MTERTLLRYDGIELAIHADMSQLASGYCNDMVVDQFGRALRWQLRLRPP